ncbi:hypothetical protein H113_01762 [Trichophyton rubrum MR1459]|uniref:Uncharacterized protein n=1 Tax=Trichophyton rubrum (strain ATCC MYA-4607 / CBS 118892) TaxID=559305 RepID=A0A080WPS8_TRIRC|nr:uncharacterized protein TERG_12423 [Trichophyton rubrum CBS 118892]EZF98390.1 hypothetical protein H113_01762 [Trichophyton rubrum MR1459]EZG09419.1 hypothetical protein H106_01614 [Trichophyton rubrum CBS 735.88]KFL62370.1 hypothetical protein TERG_12423 [Trichophyton rubrum CBS 118892]
MIRSNRPCIIKDMKVAHCKKKKSKIKKLQVHNRRRKHDIVACVFKFVRVTNRKRSLLIYNLTFTSTHGRVHSLRPSKLLNHSRPIPVHSGSLALKDAFGMTRRFASSNAAPIRAVAVVFTVSSTYPVNSLEVELRAGVVAVAFIVGAVTGK